MSDVNRELIFSEVFLDDLISIENYVGRENPKKGRMFTSKVYDYILDVIQIFPFANPKFIMDSDVIRRGVYDKNHIIIYKVLDESIELLRIYHTSKDVGNIEI
jgi:plasmid stabilization system protein ParE